MAAVALALTACDDDDKFTSRGDLFQPRFATSPEVTVKNHNERDGIKQTVLTRCKAA